MITARALAPFLTLLPILVTSCGDGRPLLFPPVVDLEPAASQEQEAAAGDDVPDAPAVRARDEHGNPVPGVLVFFEVVGGEGWIDRDVVLTDDRGIAALGQWALGPRPGPNEVTAQRRDAEADPIRFRARSSAGPPATVQPANPHLLEAPIGEAPPIALSVFVRDRMGNGIQGLAVQFRVTGGGGSLATSQAVTNAVGRANAGMWVLGTEAGIQTAEATVAGLPSIVVEARAFPGPPQTIEALEGPEPEARAGDILFDVITIEVRDAFENPIPDLSVRTRVLRGGGLVFPEEGFSDEVGRFRLSRWEVGGETGSQAVEVSVPGLDPIEFEVTADHAAPDRLELLEGHGLAGRPNTLLLVAPAVRVLDRFGNPVPDRTVEFVVVSGGGTLESAATVSDADGRAVAGSWLLGPEIGTQMVEARLTGPEGVPAFRFEAEAVSGTPLRAVVTEGDGQSHAAGYPLPGPVTIRILDPDGSAAADVPVVVEVQEGGGAVVPAEAVTDAEGLVRIESWRLGPQPGPNRLLVRPRGGDAVTVTASGIPPFHLFVGAVQLNQGNQTPTGSIAVLAGRDGVLRILPEATDENNLAPAARVILFHNRVPVLDETIERAAAGVPTEVDALDVEGSFNLPVPGSLIRAGLGIRVELDPAGEIDVPDRDRLVFPAPGSIHPVAVRATPPLEMTFVPIRSTELETTGRIDAANLDRYLEGVRSMLPIGEVFAVLRPAYTSSAAPLTGPSAFSGWASLVLELQALKVAEGSNRYYHGIVQTPTAEGFLGIGFRPSEPESPLRSAVSHDHFPLAAITVAHELGHNLGRRHSPCGNASGPDPGFPYPGATLGAPGYDVLEGRFRSAAGHHDVMSYCHPVWISDYKYARILAWRDQVPAEPEGFAAALAAPGEGLLLWGGWSGAGPELNPVFHVHAPPTPVAESGEGEVRGFDRSGRELFFQPVRGEELGHGGDGTHRYFTLLVPLGAGDREALHRIVLSTPSGELERVVGGTPNGTGPAAAPDPGLTSAPAGPGRTLVEWDAQAYPMVLVRDALDGTILSFARGGRVEVATPPSGVLDLQLGEGVRVRRQELRARAAP